MRFVRQTHARNERHSPVKGLVHGWVSSTFPKRALHNKRRKSQRPGPHVLDQQLRHIALTYGIGRQCQRAMPKQEEQGDNLMILRYSMPFRHTSRQRSGQSGNPTESARKAVDRPPSLPACGRNRARKNQHVPPRQRALVSTVHCAYPASLLPPRPPRRSRPLHTPSLPRPCCTDSSGVHPPAPR